MHELMNKCSSFDPQAEKLEALAAQYVQEGYAVVRAPSRAQLPFELGDYCPDIVASKDHTGLIVEIKSSASRLSIDRLQQLAAEVSRHPGWRFLLVTLDDVDSATIPTTLDELPDWPRLGEKLDQVRNLAANDLLAPALLCLWAIFEAGLRRRAITQQIPAERLPARMLLRHMYSQGEISVDQIDLFEEFFDKQSRLAHGRDEDIGPRFIHDLVTAVSNLIAEWQEDKVHAAA